MAQATAEATTEESGAIEETQAPETSEKTETTKKAGNKSGSKRAGTTKAPANKREDPVEDDDSVSLEPVDSEVWWDVTFVYGNTVRVPYANAMAYKARQARDKKKGRREIVVSVEKVKT